jgi:hypothetical protein
MSREVLQSQALRRKLGRLSGKVAVSFETQERVSRKRTLGSENEVMGKIFAEQRQMQGM